MKRILKITRKLSFILCLCMMVGLLGGYVQPVVAADEVVGYEDNFDTDSTENYKSTGTYTISNGTLNLTGDAYVGVAEKIWYNATYEVEVDLSGKSEWAGIQFNKQTPTSNRDSSGYLLYVRATGSVELYTGADGVIGKASASLGTDKKIKLKVVTTEGSISVYINGESKPLFEVKDSQFEYGYFNFTGFGGGDAKFDNLKITTKPSDGKIKSISLAAEKDLSCLGVGETIKLNAIVFPLDASADAFEWKITDVYGNPTSLAKVSKEGYLTAGNSTGTVRVSVVSKDDASISSSKDFVIVENAQLEVKEQENYFADFNKADSNFACLRPDSSNATFEGGKLKLSVWWPTMVNLNNYVFDDAEYEFDMNVGTDKEWAGFMFNKTNPSDIWDNSGYLFIVTPSGDYQLHQCTSGPQQITSGKISGFENKENHYKIVKKGESIKVYFGKSDTPFIDIKDENYSSGYVSFVATNAGEDAVATFDNLSIKLLGSKSVNLESLYIIPQYGASQIKKGESIKITTHSDPYIDLAGKLTWTVTKADGSKADATIDANGNLKAGNTTGKLTIKATTTTGLASTTEIEVVDSIKLEAINVVADKKQRIMGINKSVQMEAFAYPYNAEDVKIKWSVTNTDGSATTLATISEDGVLTSNAKGFVRVRATLASDTNIYSEWVMQIGAITKNGNVDMASMKTSFFAHYVADLTTDVDGKLVTDPNVLANEFDAEAYADKMAAMGVEYVVFTAWHYRMVVLGPSQAMIDWDMADHQTERDMLGDMIDAVIEKGINVVLYTHPYDGYDFKTVEEGLKTGWGSALKPAMAPYYDKDFDYDKWNDFINDVYGELIERYGDRISGIWCDEGNIGGGMAKAVDFPRLLETIKSKNPNICTIQNEHGYLYGFQYVTQEDWELAGFGDKTGEKMQTYANHIPNPIISPDWWTTRALGTENTCRFDGSVIFKYQVLQSGVVGSECGIQWSAGPYPGEGCYYEAGVVEAMEAMNAYLNPIAWTIKDTLASTSYTTMGGKTLQTIDWGIATKSVDDTKEYIHVLKNDSERIEGKTLTLPLPKDGKVFKSAYLAIDNTPVELKQDANGVYLTLTGDSDWSDYDTVIELTVDSEATKENQESMQKETTTKKDPTKNPSADKTNGSDETNNGGSMTIIIVVVVVVLVIIAGAAYILLVRNRKRS